MPKGNAQDGAKDVSCHCKPKIDERGPKLLLEQEYHWKALGRNLILSAFNSKWISITSIS